ncbi:MAG TPA: hypothetical protein VIK66_16485 [Gaiellaceae bacterium]
MSAIATTRPRATVSDRLLAAVPLASLYLWLSIAYCIEAWKRATPWLFTDELEFTQLSRSIAATGHAARRGEPHGIHSLYTVILAPLWRIDDVAAAFAAIKYVDVLAMTAVVFPTYFLARFVVGRTPALFAAAAAGAVPALAYSSWIIEETWAYPYSALCLYLIAKALLVKSRGWLAGAAVASIVAPFMRSELAMIPIAFVLAAVFLYWSSERPRAWRARWSRADWLGFVVLVAGAIILFSGVMSHHSHGWLMNTAYNWTKKRIFVYGDWAAGALAIGMGVAPMILGLAALVPARGERATRELRTFRSVAIAAVIVFGIYTAMKAAYLSQIFASRVEERNLIYIAPVLVIGTAFVLASRRVNWWALGAATAYVAYVVLGVPLFVGGGLYSDALGLAIFQQGNRYFLLSNMQARVILLVALVVTVVVTVAGTRLRPAAVALALAILAWGGTAEFAAAVGNISVSRDIRPALGEPFTWVDDATHLKPTLYLAQGVADQNPEWLLEFWNRSITTVSSLDGTVGGPGPAGAPNITARGDLYWTEHVNDVGKVFDYAVEDWPCIDFAGTLAERHFYRGGAAEPREWRLIQLTKPNRLRADCVGIYGDGWSGPNDSTYFRFVARHRGWLRITLSRQGFPGSPVDLQLGTITEDFRQAALGTVLRHEVVHIRPNRTTTVWVPTPARPFALHAVVQDKFSPGNGDGRSLGALVTYQWFLTKRQ